MNKTNRQSTLLQIFVSKSGILSVNFGEDVIRVHQNCRAADGSGVMNGNVLPRTILTQIVQSVKIWRDIISEYGIYSDVSLLRVASIVSQNMRVQQRRFSINDTRKASIPTHIPHYVFLHKKNKTFGVVC